MAESLQFSIGADTAAFTSGIGTMLTGLAGLAAAFVSAQAIISSFSDAIDLGGRLNDLSTRTGETAGNLAVLERAFDNTNVGAEKLGPAIAKMQKSMVDMAEGSKDAVAAFAQLGLAWEDLEGLSPADQMQLIGERLAAIENPALRAETAISIFGKSGAELIPILVNFSAETEEAKNQLGSLPDQLDKSAASVDALGDDLHAISNKLTELAYGFLSEVTPAVLRFTDSLTGIDAAAIGAGLADALVGAFVSPMKAVDLLNETLVLGAKLLGNELVYAATYWGGIMMAVSDPLGNAILGALEVAAGEFGTSLLSVIQSALETIQPIAFAFGLADEVAAALAGVEALTSSSEALMTDGAAKIAESSQALAASYESAKQNSSAVRQDFFGAEESSDKIAKDFADLQKDAKAAVDEFALPMGSLSDLAAGRTMSESGKDPLVSILENENLVSQTPLAKETTTKAKGKTAAQLQAEQTRTLQTIAAASPNQVIGQSFSAQKAIDKQKELDTLTALGKGDTHEADALRNSIQLNKDIASGISLTSDDQVAAQRWAFDEYFKDSNTKTMDELQDMAEQNILERKRDEDKAAKDEQAAKAQEAGAGGKPAQQQQMSLQSIAQAIQGILQKIEPKIPTHVMT